MRFHIETERLILRNLTPEDWQAAFRWFGDPDVARYMVYPVYTRAEDVRTWIETLDPDDPDEYDVGAVLNGMIHGEHKLRNIADTQPHGKLMAEPAGSGFEPLFQFLFAFQTQHAEIDLAELQVTGGLAGRNGDESLLHTGVLHVPEKLGERQPDIFIDSLQFIGCHFFPSIPNMTPPPRICERRGRNFIRS